MQSRGLTPFPFPVTYTCDLNGNLTSDGTRWFAYDDENQLVSVWVTNAWRSDFVYDGRMRRRIRREWTWAGTWVETNEVRYVYEGNLAIQERDINNLPMVTYTRGEDLSGSFQGDGGIDGLLARTDNRLLAVGDTSANAYYHADGNGNITALLSTNQVIVAEYLYDPYGNVLSQSGPFAAANTYRFSNKESDQNSGCAYYLYRFYDPNLQRWSNRDPLTEGGFENLHKSSDGYTLVLNHVEVMEAPNLYEVVYNSPLQFIDTFGLWVSGVIMKGTEKAANEAMKSCKCANCCRNAFLAAEAALHGELIGAGVEAGVQGPEGAASIVFDGIFFLWDTYDVSRDYRECMERVSNPGLSKVSN